MREGAVIATSDVRPTLDQVETVLPRFTGEIEQVPPAYSALKIGGKAAYARARAGETVEMKARGDDIVNSSRRRSRGGGPFGAAEWWRGPSVKLELPPPHASRREEADALSATVSKGTYIRSLARDIAHALGTVGHVTISGAPAPGLSARTGHFAGLSRRNR